MNNSKRPNAGLARHLRAWLVDHPGAHNGEDVAKALGSVGVNVHATAGRNSVGTVVCAAARTLMLESSMDHLPGLMSDRRGWFTYTPPDGMPAATPKGDPTPHKLEYIGTLTDGVSLYRDDDQVIYRICLERA